MIGLRSIYRIRCLQVRLPTQSENERNFHIFYQMCKGADDDERERWELQGVNRITSYSTRIERN